MNKPFSQFLTSFQSTQNQKISQLTQTQVIEIRDSLYALIETQTQNAMLANAKEEYAFHIIDPAYVPEVRIRPKRALIVLASGMLGGFFGLFLCFVIHFVKTPKKQEPKGGVILNTAS